MLCYSFFFFFSFLLFCFCRCFCFSLVINKKKRKKAVTGEKKRKKKKKRKCESADTHVLIQTEVVAPSKEQVRLLKQKQRADKTHIFYKHFALSAIISTLLVE